MGKGTTWPAAAAMGCLCAVPAQAGPRKPTRAAADPVPLTDLLAGTLSPLTGGTKRTCTVSRLGITVRCVENVRTMPSAVASASGVTFGHWIFSKRTCAGSLLVHELVHVHQFEEHGDTFGPRYLAEAAMHGTGCENKWERPAYQTSGRC